MVAKRNVWRVVLLIVGLGNYGITIVEDYALLSLNRTKNIYSIFVS